MLLRFHLVLHFSHFLSIIIQHALHFLRLTPLLRELILELIVAWLGSALFSEWYIIQLHYFRTVQPSWLSHSTMIPNHWCLWGSRGCSRVLRSLRRRRDVLSLGILRIDNQYRWANDSWLIILSITEGQLLLQSYFLLLSIILWLCSISKREIRHWISMIFSRHPSLLLHILFCLWLRYLSIIMSSSLHLFSHRLLGLVIGGREKSRSAYLLWVGLVT